MKQWSLLNSFGPSECFCNTFPPILMLCFGVACNCFHMFQQGVGALESRPVSPGGHGGSAVWCFDERAEAKEGQ